MKDLLDNIYSQVQDNQNLTESEVTDIFVDSGFFSELGYEGFGTDIRSEEHIVGKNRADYFCKDKYGKVIFVIEFKKPSRDEDLASHKPQLWEQYVKPIKADYGILTNGEEIILYRRGSRDRANRIFRRSLNNITDEHATKLGKLHKPTYEFKTRDEMESYLDNLHTVSIGEVVDGEKVGQNEFLATFKIEDSTIFYEMLESTYNLLDFYVKQDEPNFPKDAFEFWEEYYSAEATWYDLPSEWRDIAGNASNTEKIIFAIETLQSLLGRFMLAKACDDFAFPSIDFTEFITSQTREYRGQIPDGVHIVMARELMDQMRQELVESVFEQDIYYWWNAPVEGYDSGDVRDMSQVDWPTPVSDFATTLIEFLFSVARFDYGNIQGDPLGELYQEHFSQETRRALGEFYTPTSAVEYVLDSVEYEPNGSSRALSEQRLIDPACGSGTFLIKALEQYKQECEASGDANWATELKNICERSRIVGLDIHPFAVVIAQVRFMLSILPEYKEAVDEAGPEYVLKRLPIYRTDSLINETVVEEGVQGDLSFYAHYREGVIHFEMPLPIRNGGDFESMPFELPEFGHVQEKTQNQIENQQQYFSALLAVFDAVKELGGRESQYEISEDELEEYFTDYFEPHISTSTVSSAFLDTTNGFLGTVEELREDYNDGRLLKLIEDVVLSAIIKNDITHDFVVGNPPWVAKQNRYQSDEQERRMKSLYLSSWQETDPYMEFLERGMMMLHTEGELGFVVSNRYLYNSGAKELRALLAKNKINEIVDFTDFQLFEDATNYSSIICLEKEVEDDDWDSFISDNKFTNQYMITAARVREWDDEDIPGLFDVLKERENTGSVDFFEIDSSRFQERVRVKNNEVHRREMSDTFSYQNKEATVSAQLPSADVWPFCPPEEFEILDQIESQMDMRLGDRTIIRKNDVERADNLVGDDIMVGIQTSGDSAYVVHPTIGLAKEKLSKIDTLSITPRDIDGVYTVETGLLKVDITSGDVSRWLPDWKNRLVFVPYLQGDDRAELIRPTQLAEDYPRSWDYFTAPEVLEALEGDSAERKELHNKLAFLLEIIDEGAILDEDGIQDYRQVDLSTSQYEELSEKLRANVDWLNRQDKDLWWYRYMYRKNIESLPRPKLLTGNQKQRNSLCFDDEGIMAPHNARVYSFIVDEDQRFAIAGVLNSGLTEFFHKHHARIHQGKAYSYIKDYTSKWPVVVPDDSSDEWGEIESLVEEILHLKDLEVKIPQFPDPYIVNAREQGEEFSSVTFTPTSTFTAYPDVQQNLDEGYAVLVGDGSVSDGINSEMKAEYVKMALKGERLEENETVSISVPFDDDISEIALEELGEDIEERDEYEITQLEDEIDDLVFDIYGVEDTDVRELVRRYNTQYEAVRSLDVVGR